MTAPITTPTITHVAIRYMGQVYSLSSPNRHHHVIRMIGGIYGYHEEGFIDSKNQFLNRTQAMDLAKTNGQLKRRPGDNYYQGPKLFSEDLW